MKIIWFRISSSFHKSNAIFYHFNQYFSSWKEIWCVCCSVFSTICFATVLKTQGLHFSRLKVFFLFYLNIKYKYSEYDVDRWKKENFYSHIWSDPTQISNLLKHKKIARFSFAKKGKLELNKLWMIFFVGTTLSCNICRFLSQHMSICSDV